MEAIALGSQLVSSTKCQIQDSLHASLQTLGRLQSVKWAPASNQTGASLPFRCSNWASNCVRLPAFARQAFLLRRDMRLPSRTFQNVASIVKRDDTPRRGCENGLHDVEKEQSLISRFSKAASCALAAGVILFHTGVPAWADEITVIFPGSKIGEVITVQRTLIEAWGIIRETYVDASFNHQDWDLMLQETLADTLSLTSSEDAYSKVRTMLASLGDPFTRIITPKEYESFRINNDGALEGVGLLIASEQDTGRMIVMSPIEGGPAARAGIIPGDELLQIDDQVLTGLNGDEVATRLRGRAGTSVTLILRRSITDVGGLNGEPIEFKLQRETISLSPVYSKVLAHAAPNGRLTKTGYIRLSAFSQNAAAEMERAISLLMDEGVGSFILDLRNNPGGLVKAGLDVAQMWLDGNGVLVNTIDREGYTQPITLVNGHSLTSDPLIVLVNKGTASASEILAGALHDNGRALIVGERTFGKGKIQSVTELADGSALFVTVAKYLSPGLHQIDHVGIAPDLKCSPDELPSYPEESSAPPAAEKVKYESNVSMKLSSARLAAEKDKYDSNTMEQGGFRRLQSDSCIMVAEHELDKSVSS